MSNTKCGWTVSQGQRLRELNAPENVLEQQFPTERERNMNFLELEQTYVRQSREHLRKLRENRRRPRLCELEEALAKALRKAGFVQVVTPILISKTSLDKMSIRSEHKLYKQVFWVGDKKCLRPMLASNLYSLLRKLEKIWVKPIRIFEVGPCFRKDTAGKHHMNEFTMLNLVEMGLPVKTGQRRLKELADMVMKTSGIKDYRTVTHKSEVYGQTIDFVAGIELASGVIGPHPLDSRWGITDPWVGIGFGLERLLMVRENFGNIQRAGRALLYLDGERLNI